MAAQSDDEQQVLGFLFTHFVDWHNRDYAAPSPHFVKQTVVLRHALQGSTWIETGTYTGDTTQLLSQAAGFVYSIEPEPTLYDKAVERFRAHPNVLILKGLSEAVLPTLLPTLAGDVSFWLDGHYSGGVSFKGPHDTPIVLELAAIAGNLARWRRVTVLVDDVRCFNPRDPDFANYPTADFLVDWARANRFTWQIEHDIFIAKNY